MTVLLLTLTHAHALRRITNMTITYAIWQGSRLLSVDNIATDITEIDTLINTLNASDMGKKIKFCANVMEIKVNK